MEILFALAALGLAVVYGVVIIVGVEKRSSWAIELSRLMALMHGNPVEFPPREAPIVEAAAETDVEDESAPPEERLVA